MQVAFILLFLVFSSIEISKRRNIDKDVVAVDYDHGKCNDGNDGDDDDGDDDGDDDDGDDEGDDDGDVNCTDDDVDDVLNDNNVKIKQNTPKL